MQKYLCFPTVLDDPVEGPLENCWINPSSQRHGEIDPCEFQASLLSTASSSEGVRPSRQVKPTKAPSKNPTAPYTKQTIVTQEK